MKNIRKILAVLISLFFHSLFSQGTWTQKANVDTFHTQQTVGFAVYGKGYAIGGPDCFAGFAKQVLEYDPLSNTWTRLADFPGMTISGGAGFSIGNFGYVLTGRGLGNNDMSRELWEFNPLLKTWSRKADLPGPSRCDAFTFSIGKKGYIGAGYDSVFNRISDFWEWEQTTNIWTKKANFPGGNRSQATGFSLNNKGYAGLGASDTTACTTDFYQYDPATNTWSAVAAFIGGCSSMQTSFTICDRAYLGTGLYFAGNSWYEFEPALNKWTQLTNVPGPWRKDAFAFSINKKGYIGTGASSSSCLNDFYEFSPSTVPNCNLIGINEETVTNSLRIYPNPFSAATTIDTDGKLSSLEFEIRDLTGKILRRISNDGSAKIILDRGSLAAGVYFLFYSELTGSSKPAKLVVTD